MGTHQVHHSASQHSIDYEIDPTLHAYQTRDAEVSQNCLLQFTHLLGRVVADCQMVSPATIHVGTRVHQLWPMKHNHSEVVVGMHVANEMA